MTRTICPPVVDSPLNFRKLTIEEESIAHLAAIVNSSDDAIIGKSLDSIVTSWNGGAEKMFGYSAKEMIGSSIVRLFPSGFQEDETEIIETIKRGESVRAFDAVRMTKQGVLLDVSVTVSPIKDKTGKVVGASKVARDITDRKIAEESTARLAAIVSSSNDAIIGKDLNGIITSWNTGAERIFGYSATEMIGGPIARLIPADRQQEELEIIRRLKKGESVEHFETFRLERDGRQVDISVTVSPIKDKAGKIVGASKVARDITERRRAEAEIRELNRRLEERVSQLEAANKELEAFSYSVSHDLRTPLRAVDGFSQSVMEDYSALLPEQGRKDLQTIRVATQRMGTLIDDLLNFSRLNRIPLKSQEVNTCNLVRNALESLTSQWKGRQVDFQIGELPTCQGDPALLGHVWINLLSNAIKYTRNRANAVIGIGCKREQEENVYFVKDNGAGFDMRYANKLFGVFQRLHRVDEFEGTGVGLAIVQRIIHRHGGRIWADATINQGATFSFALNEKALL